MNKGVENRASLNPIISALKMFGQIPVSVEFRKELVVVLDT